MDKINQGTSNENESVKPASLEAEDGIATSIKQYVQTMYEDFKRCLENKKFAQIDIIIQNIKNINPLDIILDAIYGQMYLVKGNGEKAYEHLFNYGKNAESVDLDVLGSMALWNLFAGKHFLALKQFSDIVEGPFPAKFLIFVMVNVAKTKKLLGFYDRAMIYLERLLAITDGYSLMMVIKLETIHIQILKKDYHSASEEIETYFRFGTNFYIRRLRAYLLYVKGDIDGLIACVDEENNDPYISYIIGRAALENVGIEDMDGCKYLEAAVKQVKGNKYFYNTLGNFYALKNNISDAAEQYNNALLIDPKFNLAIQNLKKICTKEIIRNDFNEKTTQDLYLDISPDIEELGFLDIWKLMGYSGFEISHDFLKKMPDLKFYGEKKSTSF